MTVRCRPRGPISSCSPVADSTSRSAGQPGAMRPSHASPSAFAGLTVTVSEGFDPTLTCEERIAYLDNPDLIRERVKPHVEALLWAEHLVFVFPTWFHGPPSMLKGWLERVWLPGVAFLPAERKGQLAKSGMRHIRRLTVVTTGGSPRWFVMVIGDPGRRLFTRALRALFAWRCKVTWLQLHDMNAVTANDRTHFIERVSRKLSSI